jgi:hypothetical protein
MQTPWRERQPISGPAQRASALCSWTYDANYESGTVIPGSVAVRRLGDRVLRRWSIPNVVDRVVVSLLPPSRRICVERIAL